MITLLTSEEINLLSKIGFVAIAHRDKTRAIAIFSLLKRLRPNSSLPIIGLALTWIGIKEPIHAINLLEKTFLHDSNEQSIILIYLGLALILDKKYKESRRILNMVLKKVDDNIKLCKESHSSVNENILQAYEMGKELLKEINQHNLV